MKKNALIATVVGATLISSIGFASPMNDYSAGKASVDLTMRQSDVSMGIPNKKISFDKKNNWEYGLTAGLGNNFAIQYNGYNAKSDNTLDYQDASVTSTMDTSLKTQEINVLYKLNNNVSAFAGLVRVKGTFYAKDVYLDGTVDVLDNSKDTKNKMQIGLIGSTKIANKTTAYASIGVASDYTSWKVGVSQEIAPNVEFNVDYRRTDVKNVNFVGLDAVDLTAKGVGFGVSYKF